MNLIENYSLKGLNTFGIEVTAAWFGRFNNTHTLLELLTKVGRKEMMILGGGSNVLFTKDVQGVVLKNEIVGIEVVQEDSDNVYVKAGAGVVWHELVMYCVELGYQGIENLSLIPGCVGASPMQNIGAYGVELKDVFHKLEALDIETGTIREFSLAECEFGYRESVFKRKFKNQFIILNVTLKLNKKPVYNTSYGAIKDQLEAHGVKSLSVKAISNAVISIRQSKLPNPAEIGNAGSFFKNPEILMEHYSKLKVQFEQIVAYPVDETHMKLAAGWLIEQSGWKGKTFEEKYGVHKLQALVLVNYGGATGNQLYQLSQNIIDSVKAKFGVTLEREVNIY